MSTLAHQRPGQKPLFATRRTCISQKLTKRAADSCFDAVNAARYHRPLIKSFRDRDTERLFDRQPARRFGTGVQKVALRKLRMLDAATTLDDLRVPPGNRLERLRSDRSGQHSIRINDRWRICFRWHGSDAYEVEIADYH